MPRPAPATNQWSEIVETTEYLEKLRLLCNTPKELALSGYIKSLSPEQLQSKLRCLKCGERAKRTKFQKKKHAQIASLLQLSNDATSSETAQMAQLCNSEVKKGAVGAIPKKPSPASFTCCGQHISEVGCVEAQSHNFPPLSDVSFQRNWKYHTTPGDIVRSRTRRQRGINSIGGGQGCTSKPRHVHAVALDCEMGMAATGDSELIRLTAIDFFTQEVLIDQLVKPNVKMQHLNTKYSGVKNSDMFNAVKRGECLFGRDAARQKLWNFIGPETIIIVHGGSNDMTALRWYHPLVIDTFILESYGAGVEGGRSLKNLCQRHLNLSVQAGKGHDSLEDAAACRELAHRWVSMIPS